MFDDETWPIVQALRRQPKNWIDFMMRFELGLEKPDPRRALVSALTIAGAYRRPMASLAALRHLPSRGLLRRLKEQARG